MGAGPQRSAVSRGLERIGRIGRHEGLERGLLRIPPVFQSQDLSAEAWTQRVGVERWRQNGYMAGGLHRSRGGS